MLNTNQVKRDKSARKDHALKLGLELVLYKKIRPLFSSVSKQFKNQYAETGTVVNLDGFSEDLNNILQEHYTKVSDKFNSRIVDEIGKPENHEAVIDRIDNITQSHHYGRAEQSASIITKTTQKDISESVLNSIEDLSKQDIAITNESVAKAAKLKIDQKISGRLNTISASETQNPAEHAKQTEIETLNWHDAEIDGEPLSDRNIKKQWVAILDGVTRLDHAEADSEFIDINDPYNVGGEKLMYPGDLSLGASLGNVINCRCSSVPIIK